MKAALIYGSNHGKTARVVAEVLQHLELCPDVYNARELPNPARVRDYDLLLFFCPTYGDEELQEDMEEFLLRLNGEVAGKYFAICELGSYYGYDDFSFGAMRIIRARLLQLKGRELCEPLSLDSYPRTHWDHLLDWTQYLKAAIEEHDGH